MYRFENWITWIHFEFGIKLELKTNKFKKLKSKIKKKQNRNLTTGIQIPKMYKLLIEVYITVYPDINKAKKIKWHITPSGRVHDIKPG